MSTDEMFDRRRPGRAIVEPVLVPLLRQVADSKLTSNEAGPLLSEASSSETTVDQVEDGSLIRGILFGLLLAVPFWIVVALAVLMLLR